jgi:hypothetical protein
MAVLGRMVGSQADGGQQGGVIAEVAASGAVVISARSDLPYPDAGEAVVQTLAAEAGIDPAVVASGVAEDRQVSGRLDL